ncbi:MAG: NAD(P)H-binding protein [Bacteroidia bacterium]
MKKAIVFGASGFIGAHLLHELLNNNNYEQVTTVVRKSQNITHPKLKTLIGDFYSLPKLKEAIQADDIFITLGTTKKQTPNEKEYYRIDHDYPVLAAKMAKENGAKSVFVVSSIGANVNAKVFYIKTKGELEQDIIALGFEHTNIFQPSLLTGNRKESRPVEKIFINIFTVLNPLFIGSLNKYKSIDGKTVAKAINNAAKNQTEKVKVYQWKEMNSLL